MKALARRAIYQTLRHAGVVALERSRRVKASRGWATILVFHTLSDKRPHDGICMSPGLFAKIARELAASYDVISMDSLLARISSGPPLTGREAVITFDDGYLDNYFHAAPVLHDLGLPALFYLTAGYVGTEHQFPWDAARGYRTEMMSWDQAREMHRMGLTLGCHTWSHPDLGTEPIESASRELHDARGKIENEIGAPVRHFAYPFGGVDNIRPDWLDAIKQEGFASNVRCHGGQVFAGDDPYWIARTGCHQRTVTDVRIVLDDPW